MTTVIDFVVYFIKAFASFVNTIAMLQTLAGRGRALDAGLRGLRALASLPDHQALAEHLRSSAQQPLDTEKRASLG